jgi:hypothetical protein
LPLIVVAGAAPTGIGEESVSTRSHGASDHLARMRRKMTPSEQDPPALATTEPPRPGGQVVAVAVALLEAAALTAAMRRVASWNPLLPLYAAADRMWTASASEDQQGWRTDPSTHAADVRLAVLVPEATIGRCLAEDGYLSARELSVDLRHAAAWLAAGAQFGP